MKSIIKPYREGYILYDVSKRKFNKLSLDECKAVESGKIEEIDDLKILNIGFIRDSSFKIQKGNYIFIETKTPLKAFWDITEVCNARCIHCFTNAGEKASGELTTKQAFSVIDELVRHGIMGIAFSGGEPMIRDDFIEILQYSADRGMLISFTTNGVLLNLDKIIKITELQLKSVTISLDGFSQEISNQIRRGISVERVKENIKLLSQYSRNKKLEVNVRTTLNEINKVEIYDILKFCDDAEITCLKINNTNLWGRAKDKPSLRLKEQDFINTLIQVEKKAKEYSCRVELPIEKYLNIGTSSLNSEICTSTIDTINIFSNGDIGACGFCEKKLIFGNIIKNGLTKIFIKSLPFDFHNEVCQNCYIHKYSSNKKMTTADSFIN